LRFTELQKTRAVFVTVSMAEEVEIPIGVSAIITMSSGIRVIAAALNECI